MEHTGHAKKRKIDLSFRECCHKQQWIKEDMEGKYICINRGSSNTKSILTRIQLFTGGGLVGLAGFGRGGRGIDGGGGCKVGGL